MKVYERLTIVHQGADDRAPDLRHEHGARWNLEILAHLEIAGETNAGRDHVVTPHRDENWQRVLIRMRKV